MKSLYEPSTAEEVKSRLNALTPDTQRLWGKMTVAQMLAHCANAQKAATGDRQPPRVFIGRILGPLVKAHFANDEPMRRSSPTAPWLMIADDRDFTAERNRLTGLVDRFSQGGPAACTRHPHAFFGNMSTEEWGKGMYKHLDHHLQQFGV